MKPMHLVICGWGPFREETEIDFTVFDGNGLFLITGPTGAGKTTVFDAITYALYGAMSGPMREKGSVRSDFADAGTPTFVRFQMSHGGAVYTVMRNPEYLRPKKREPGACTKEKENAVLYLPDGSVIEGTAAVNRKLKEILVLDERQFKQISMIAQGEFARMLSATGAEKTKIFREIFGTGIYSRLAELFREKAGALYRQVMEYRHRMEEDVRLFTAGDEKWQTLTEGESCQYDAVCDDLKRQIGTWKKEEAALRKKSAGLEEKILEGNRAYSEAKAVNEKLDQLADARKKLAVWKQQEKMFDRLRREKERADAAESVRADRERLLAVRQQLTEGKKQLEILREELSALETEQRTLLIWQERQEEIRNAFGLAEKIQELEAQLKIQAKILADRQKECSTLREAFAAQDEETQKKRERYEEADSRYKRAAVGIAARLVREGEPCPVCGSISHPRVAQVSEEIPDEEELRLWKAQYEEAQEKRQTLFAETQAACVKLEEAEEKQKELTEETAQYRQKQAQIGAKIQALVKEPFAAERKRFEEKVERALALQTIAVEKKRHIGHWEQMTEEQEQTEKQLEAVWRQAVAEQGFADEAECLDSLRDKKRRQELEEILWKQMQEKQSVSALCQHLEQETAGKQRTDLEALLEQTEALRNAKKEEDRRLGETGARAEEAERIRASLHDYQKKIGPLEEEYGLLGDLDHLSNGRNEKRLVFEQYVLAGYFEQILHAANLRLLRMSEGRFELKRASEASDGRVRDSMEMLVMDYYTGRSRSVKTLSGGESFQASLALALGMSDVVQAESGGIQVEALFVDEGFGALDAEALDQACTVLAGLGGGEKIVGIISHVPELRERIGNQIIVEKTNHGSRICQRNA